MLSKEVTCVNLCVRLSARAVIAEQTKYWTVLQHGAHEEAGQSLRCHASGQELVICGELFTHGHPISV